MTDVGGTRPLTEERWEIAVEVDCVVCPSCAFTFDARHEDLGGGYSCPHCAELKLTTEVARLERRVAELEENTVTGTPLTPEREQEIRKWHGGLTRFNPAIAGHEWSIAEIVDDLLAALDAARAERDAARRGRIRYQKQADERTRRLIAVRREVAALREELEQACDNCARPPGVCFDRAALAGEENQPK